MQNNHYAKSHDQSPNAAAPPILILAALLDEIIPTVQRLRLTKQNGQYVGEINNTPVIAAITGIGGQRAVKVLQHLVNSHQPGCVVLIGFAGGLDPRLQVGTVLSIEWMLNEHDLPIRIPMQSKTRSEASDVSTISENVNSSVHRSTNRSLLTVDRVADSVATKKSLFSFYNCGGVDMESYFIAQYLTTRGIPLSVLRAISDPANTSLPTAAVHWITQCGEVNRLAVFRHLVTHPWQFITLLKLRQHTRIAAENLAHHTEKLVDHLTAVSLDIS